MPSKAQKFLSKGAKNIYYSAGVVQILLFFLVASLPHTSLFVSIAIKLSGGCHFAQFFLQFRFSFPILSRKLHKSWIDLSGKLSWWFLLSIFRTCHFQESWVPCLVLCQFVGVFALFVLPPCKASKVISSCLVLTYLTCNFDKISQAY